MSATRNSTARAPEAATPPWNLRRLFSAPEAAEPRRTAPEAGVKLQTRKLSFDSHVSKLSQAKRSEDDPTSSVGGEGLPSLLKRLRHDAQLEIEHATAHATQMHLCLAREIRMLEREEREMAEAHMQRIDTLQASHQEQVGGLQAEVQRLTDAFEQLRGEKRLEEEARASAEQRCAELVKQVAAMEVEVGSARERADAMEAATALLQSEESPVTSPAHKSAARFKAERLGVSDEARQGARCVTGSVSLVNVPAMNGGSFASEHGTLDSGVFVSPRDPNLISPAVAPLNGGRKLSLRSGAPSGAPSDALPSAPSAASQGGGLQRKMSFGRKAGRKLVRSLSFGHEERKREWGSAAT